MAIWKRFITAITVGGMLWACSNDSSGPSGGGDPGPGVPGEDVVSATATDPTGDFFGNRGPQWDITSMTVTRDTEFVTVVLEFASAPISPVTGDSNAMISYIDLDTDQDSVTGQGSIVDEFRRDSGSTRMSSDYRIDLATFAQDSSVIVFNEEAIVMGHVKPKFDGKKVTVRVPRSMLGGDDGFLWASAIVGTVGSPTDIVPEVGHLELNRPASASLR